MLSAYYQNKLKQKLYSPPKSIKSKDKKDDKDDKDEKETTSKKKAGFFDYFASLDKEIEDAFKNPKAKDDKKEDAKEDK